MMWKETEKKHRTKARQEEGRKEKGVKSGEGRVLERRGIHKAHWGELEEARRSRPRRPEV